jgi:hypothetical protein
MRLTPPKNLLRNLNYIMLTLICVAALVCGLWRPKGSWKAALADAQRIDGLYHQAFVPYEIYMFDEIQSAAENEIGTHSSDLYGSAVTIERLCWTLAARVVRKKL